MTMMRHEFWTARTMREMYFSGIPPTEGIADMMCFLAMRPCCFPRNQCLEDGEG